MQAAGTSSLVSALRAETRKNQNLVCGQTARRHGIEEKYATASFLPKQTSRTSSLVSAKAYGDESAHGNGQSARCLWKFLLVALCVSQKRAKALPEKNPFEKKPHLRIFLNF
jgi:hypothetical protein